MATAAVSGDEWTGTGLSTSAIGDLMRDGRGFAEGLVVSVGRDGDGRSAIYDWVKGRTESVYPSPRVVRKAPEPSTTWVHVVFVVAYFVYLFATAANPAFSRSVPLGIQVVLYIAAWVIVAKVVGSSNEARVNRWWAEYDPHRRERGRLSSALHSTVYEYFKEARNEYYRPVASVPGPEVESRPRVGLKWVPRGPRPNPMPACTDRQAEFLAKAWMEFLGEGPCTVSAATRDGGADVVSPRFMAEVKHHASVIPPAMVRAVVGVAHVEGKRALFFARTGYTAAAVEFADRAGAALFVYDHARGTLTGTSRAAERALVEGLPSIAPSS